MSMQNVHGYFRPGLGANSYRFRKTGPIPRAVAGLTTFTEQVFWRGTYAWMADTAWPIGKVHPKFPFFFAQELQGSPVPSFGGECWDGTLEFLGVYNPDNTIVQEEIGEYRQGCYFPKLDNGAPALTGIPGRPSGVNNTQINQLVKSYARKYISTTRPQEPVVSSSGVESKPPNWVQPPTPAALTWLVDSQATYTFPNGWYLGNRNHNQIRLTDGTLIPLYDVTEQWLYVPAKSTLTA